MYKLIYNSNTIQRLTDGAIIPCNPTLGAWQEYQDWLAEGNTPQPADVIPEYVTPDWVSFNSQLLSNTLWINWGLNADLRIAIISAAVTGNLAALQTAYDIAKNLTPPPPPGAIEEWQEIANNCSIGLVF